MNSIKYFLICLVSIILVFAILFINYFELNQSLKVNPDGSVVTGPDGLPLIDYLGDTYISYYFPLEISLPITYNNGIMDIGTENIATDTMDDFIRYAVHPDEVGELVDGKIVFVYLIIMEYQNTDPNLLYEIPNFPFEIVYVQGSYILRSMTPYRGFGYNDDSHIARLIYSFTAVTIQHISNSFSANIGSIIIGDNTLDGVLIPTFKYIAQFINGVSSIFESVFSFFDIFGSAVLQYGGT